MAAQDVASLVFKLRSNIDSIHTCIQSLSDTKSHDDAISKLEADHEVRTEELRLQHEKGVKELATKRRHEFEELAAQRKREEEEIA
jgi:uncharacterized protein YigA (DUF484 family)